MLHKSKIESPSRDLKIGDQRRSSNVGEQVLSSDGVRKHPSYSSNQTNTAAASHQVSGFKLPHIKASAKDES